jgi:hypothetical protein
MFAAGLRDTLKEPVAHVRRSSRPGSHTGDTIANALHVIQEAPAALAPAHVLPGGDYFAGSLSRTR